MSEPVTRHLVDSVLYLLISDSDFIGLVRGLIPPEFFGSVWGEKIARLCYRYFESFDRAPREHFQDEFARLLEMTDKEDHELLIEFARRITSLEQPNRDYIISRLNDFIRSRELEATAIDIAKLVQRGNYTDAERRMYRALKSGIERRNIGLDYLYDFSTTTKRYDLLTPLTSTGWKLLDRKIGGLYRGRFVVLLGKYKGKKTWTMGSIAREALMRGLTVVHITHEMSDTEIEIRYDRVFGAMVKDEEARDIEVSRWNPLTKRFDHQMVRGESVYDIKKVISVREKVRRFGGRLIIKKYPMGTADMHEIDRYLRYLEQFEGIVPDVLINDYADIMAPIDPKKAGRDQINETYIYHKRLADERNMLVVTGSQATREAIEKKSFSMKDFAEDIRKVANSDLCIGVCQTKEQEALNISRAVVVFARDQNVVGAEVVFGHNLDIGQLVTWEADPSDFNQGGAE